MLRVIQEINWVTFFKNLIKKSLNDNICKAFLYSLAISFIIHSSDIFSFVPGNHDWFRLENMLPIAQLQAARPITALSYLLTSNKNVIIMLYLLGLIFASMTGTLSVYYLFRQKDTFSMACGGIFISIIPYITALLFYRCSIFQFFLASFLAVLSLILLCKKGLKFYVTGTVCTLLAMCTYGTVICIFPILLMSRIVVLSSNGKSWLDNKRELTHTFVRSSSGVIIGLVMYFLVSYIITTYFGKMYNAKTIKIIDIIPRSYDALKYGFLSIMPTTIHAYMPNWIKYILFGSFIASFVLSITSAKREISNYIVLVLSYILIIFGVKAYVPITDGLVWWAHRSMLFGPGFLFLFSISYLLLRKEIWIRNITFALTIIILWFFAVQDLRFAQHMKLAFFRDLELTNRILARIENLPQISNDKLKYYQIGNIGSISSFLHRSEFSRMDHPFSFSQEHPSRPGNLMKFLSPYRFSTTSYVDRGHGFIKDDVLNYKMLLYSQHHSWPDPKAVVQVGTDAVLVVLQTPQNLASLLKQFESKLTAEGKNIDHIRQEVFRGNFLKHGQNGEPEYLPND